MASDADVRRRTNAEVLLRMAGVKPTPATDESRTDPRNPNVVSPSCDVERSGSGSITGLGRVPPRCAPHLRLAWCAPTRA